MLIETSDAVPLSEFFVGRTVVNDRVSRFQQPGGKHDMLSQHLSAKVAGANETRFVWYPRRYFEMIIEEMDRYAANGLRVYFGEYEPGHPAEGQLGLLLVLTRQTEQNKTADLLFEEQPDFQARNSLPRSREVLLLPADDEGTPREFNLCAPCPPVCKDQEPSFPENEVS